MEMPWAQETLANFMTEHVHRVVRQEVLDPRRSKGKLFAKPRIFNDLLSSQPLCFNLFAFVYPEANDACRVAVEAYSDCLSDARTFQPWTLERVCETIARHTADGWVGRFVDRYLDFGKLDRLMARG